MHASFVSPHKAKLRPPQVDGGETAQLTTISPPLTSRRADQGWCVQTSPQARASPSDSPLAFRRTTRKAPRALLVDSPDSSGKLSSSSRKSSSTGAGAPACSGTLLHRFDAIDQQPLKHAHLNDQLPPPPLLPTSVAQPSGSLVSAFTDSVTYATPESSFNSSSEPGASACLPSSTAESARVGCVSTPPLPATAHTPKGSGNFLPQVQNLDGTHSRRSILKSIGDDEEEEPLVFTRSVARPARRGGQLRLEEEEEEEKEAEEEEEEEEEEIAEVQGASEFGGSQRMGHDLPCHTSEPPESQGARSTVRPRQRKAKAAVLDSSDDDNIEGRRSSADSSSSSSPSRTPPVKPLAHANSTSLPPAAQAPDNPALSSWLQQQQQQQQQQHSQSQSQQQQQQQQQQHLQSQSQQQQQPHRVVSSFASQLSTFQVPRSKSAAAPSAHLLPPSFLAVPPSPTPRPATHASTAAAPVPGPSTISIPTLKSHMQSTCPYPLSGQPLEPNIPAPHSETHANASLKPLIPPACSAALQQGASKQQQQQQQQASRVQAMASSTQASMGEQQQQQQQPLCRPSLKQQAVPAPPQPRQHHDLGVKSQQPPTLNNHMGVKPQQPHTFHMGVKTQQPPAHHKGSAPQQPPTLSNHTGAKPQQPSTHQEGSTSQQPHTLINHTGATPQQPPTLSSTQPHQQVIDLVSSSPESPASNASSWSGASMYSVASSRAHAGTANAETGSRGAGASTQGGSDKQPPKQAPHVAQGKAVSEDSLWDRNKGSRSTSTSAATTNTGGRTAESIPTHREGAQGVKGASTTSTSTTSSTDRATGAEPCLPPAAAQSIPGPRVAPPKEAPLPQPSPAAAAAAAAAATLARKRRSSKASTAAQKAFEAEREELARTLYCSWNSAVFGGRLPPDLPLVWNPRLVATAGQVLDDGSRNSMKTAKDQRIPCRLELSNRLLSTLPRLRSTLAHEMCHVAAWAIEGDYTTPHGRAFWKWANALMAHDARSVAAATTQPPAPSPSRTPSIATSTAAALGAGSVGSKRAAVAGNGVVMGRSTTIGSSAAGVGIAATDAAGAEGDREEGVEGEDGRLIITRLHSFQTHMPHRWLCSNAGCGKVYTRHRNSIDVQRHVCAQCRGRLQYLGRFSKNNQLLAPRGDKQPATPGQSTPGLTAATTTTTTTTTIKGKAPVTPNAYALFVKEHMSTIKSAHPKGTPMSTIMKAVSSKWTEHKARTQQPAGSKQPDSPTPAIPGRDPGADGPELPLPRRLSTELGRMGRAASKCSPTASDAAASASQNDACSAASDACELDVVLIRDQE